MLAKISKLLPTRTGVFFFRPKLPSSMLPEISKLPPTGTGFSFYYYLFIILFILFFFPAGWPFPA
jgi:hypothetical protein